MKITGNIKHSFLCSDTERAKLCFIDESGVITNEIDNVFGTFDLWVLPNNNVMYAHNSGLDTAGVTVIDKDGAVIMHYRAGKELFSCQPLENGNILLGLLGEPELREIDLKFNVINSIAVDYEGLSHEGMRLARKVNDAYYLVQPGINKIRKLNLNGEIIKEYDIHPDAFGLVVLENGNIVYTCMSGAYELDQNGAEVWSLTNNDVPEINIRWLLGVQLLSNGNLVFTNWMGHGHLDEGVHFFEVNKQKQVVWSLDSRGTLLMPATLQILDEDPNTVCFKIRK